MAPHHRRGPWVPEEDSTLIQLVHEQGPNNWVRISQQMHFRSPKQCRERFHQNLKPTLNHTPISADEGLMIERMVNEMGKRWAEIARRLGNRSDNAVKNWWNGNMNRKRRGLAVQTTSPSSSRTVNGRIEHPYPRASSHHIRRLSNSSSLAKARSNHSPVTVSSLILHEKTSSSQENDSSQRLAPILTSASPISSRLMEPAITSPVYSEISTLEPPSMVSDHNSVSSASPRTLPSPQMMPLPLDGGQMYFTEQQRRGSAPVYSFLQHSNSSPEEVYISHNNAEKESQSLVRHWSIDHQYNSSSNTRDSRMGLQSLLN